MVGSVLRVRYELTQLTQDGAIFATYSARDRLQSRELCVRLIKAPYVEDPGFVLKLKEIVERYSQVQHPGVETIQEVDEDEGTPFLLSDMTPGVPLGERIRRLAPFSVPVSVSTAISLCEGLEALHSLGSTHGDVTSQSVMALPDGQVRLQYAGFTEAYAANSTASAAMLPIQAPYLAPELSAGASPTPASDVYAAGVLLYELLTGRLPYNAETPISMALKHATGTVPSVRMYNPSVPAVLDELVKKALSKEPGGRYATAGALLSDLRVLQDALRFGRTVTWPITPESTPPQVESMPRTAPRKEVPVKEKRQKGRREPSDVPLFLWILIAIFGAAAATMLGIWIFFNLSKPTLVKVPSLAGMTITEAQSMVQFSKLDVQVVAERASEQVPKDHILSTDPDAGEMVREGGHIRVVMSTGSQYVVVPNLKGNTTDQARSILQAAKLQLDENILSQRSQTVEAGRVISQTPIAGKKVDQTSTVRITVSSGNGGAGQTNIYTLRVTLSKIEAPVTVRVDMTDDLGTETIYEDIESPEATIELIHRGVGKQVTFKIYYDGELVREVTQLAEQGTPVDQVNREDQNQ